MGRKYKDQGLVVIGVHTPEFSFEHNVDNVVLAANDMRVDHPVAIDNDYAIWNAFANNYWPALYFVDAMGRIRHHNYGEGAYEESERVIQRLLSEAGANGIGPELVLPLPAALKLLPIGTTWGLRRAIWVWRAPRISRPRELCYEVAHAPLLLRRS